MPDEVDVDGMWIKYRSWEVKLLGKATRVSGDKYRVLANWLGALVLMEVTLRS